MYWVFENVLNGNKKQLMVIENMIYGYENI